VTSPANAKQIPRTTGAGCSVASAAVTVVVVLLVVILALLLAGALVGLALELLWLVITGLIIGGLGRLVLPGRQVVGLLPTALVGIAASLLGGILADLFDAGWLVRFLVAVALAAIGITLLGSAKRSRGGLDAP
jgi:uncharacterized membrane protein YeaQ/YmgE (transglycosylase-associated protein family)